MLPHASNIIEYLENRTILTKKKTNPNYVIRRMSLDHKISSFFLSQIWRKDPLFFFIDSLLNMYSPNEAKGN